MALKLTSKGAVRFSWADATMEAIWTLRPEDTQGELVSKMKQIVAFIENQEKPQLPERTPGLALEMTQMAHPRLIPVTEGEGMAMKQERPGSVANGWAAYAGSTAPQPELPEDRKGEWEVIPPGEAEE